MSRHFLLSGLLLALLALPARAEPYSLEALRSLARQAHPALAAARDQLEASRAQKITAGAYPNPEVEFLAGRDHARLPGVATGSTRSWSFTQRLDYPQQRQARLGAADAGLDAAQAGLQEFEVDLMWRLSQSYYDLLRRQAEVRATREDLALVSEIRRRVGVRVESGEAPRYELIKADAELLNAQKAQQAAQLRVVQARAALRALVAPSLPESFEVTGDLAQQVTIPAPDSLRQEVLARNPVRLRSQAEVRRAEQQLELERSRRLPDLALRVAEDRDTEVRNARVGLVLSVPLWDRRAGPVAEAVANLSRNRHELAARDLALEQALETAWQQYELARSQVQALQGGILKEAESALKVAEAAYRFGERGILDYLDAQRVFRAARNELIAARYDLQLAVLEIERLRAAY